jgi:hypothetical protein
MWYKIQYNKLVVLLLPTFLRKPIFVSFLRALILPLDQIYYSWYNWRIENIYKLQHTGQVCSLRGSLNDKFDQIQRRIYLGDGQQNPTAYIYTQAEAQNVFTNIESEPKQGTLYVYTEAETADNGLDFIVYVPFEILNVQIYALKAHIEFYKAGGKRYAIIGI